jgi:hypothetical protein
MRAPKSQEKKQKITWLQAAPHYDGDLRISAPPPLPLAPSFVQSSTCSLSESPQPLSSTTLSPLSNTVSFLHHPPTWFKRFTLTAPGPVPRLPLTATATSPTPTVRASVSSFLSLPVHHSFLSINPSCPSFLPIVLTWHQRALWPHQL